jgi:hypothetical protein
MYEWAPSPRWWETGGQPYAGLGDAATAEAAVATGAGLAVPVVAAVVPAIAAAQVAAGAGVASILGMTAAVAVPVIGAAIAVVATIAELLIKNSGCGITCVETSQWANQAEPVLAKNVQAYFSNPAPRSQSQQQAALNIFDTTWARLQQLCGQPGTGNAGVRCISDRQAGACKWTQTATSPLLSIPGEPQVGACWNWFNGYRDPIANDPNVVTDAELAAAAISPVASVGGSISTDISSLTSSSWFPIAALAAGGILLYMAATK